MNGLAMRIYIGISLVYLFVSVSLTASSAESILSNKEIQKLKKQYVEYCLSSIRNEKDALRFSASISPKGMWPNIDYVKNMRGSWPCINHLMRLRVMAQAYCKPGFTSHNNPLLAKQIASGVLYWLKNDFKNDNWWFNQISVPKAMADILILMEETLPESIKQKAIKTILSRSEIKMTGQNRVWLSGIVFVRGLLENNENMVRQGCDAILSEVKVSQNEGIQPDWSFHQHGPQLQFGNYGLSFGFSVLTWANICKGTSYEMTPKQLLTLRNYFLDGTSWVIWKGYMDISACGRQIQKNAQSTKGKNILIQLAKMSYIDREHRADYNKVIQSNKRSSINAFTGNKHFWRSDMMVHRTPFWYASVKMCSPRVIGTESTNRENVKGMHLADGALYVYRTGAEYMNIMPYWDWQRLPGTTCEKYAHDLSPSSKTNRLENNFAGGVTDGKIGIAAIDFKRGNLQAKKSWFFLDNSIVALGAGINCKSPHKVATSIEQSVAQGSVAPYKHRSVNNGEWVVNSDIAYKVIEGDRTFSSIEEKTGNWKDIFRSTKSQPAKGNVFSLWIDHGKNPINKKYAYIVYPGGEKGKANLLAAQKFPEIETNSDTLQSIRGRDYVMAVFYNKGSINVFDKYSFTVDSPCLMIVRQLANQLKIYISDPTQKKESIGIQINGKPYKIVLPKGGDAGRSAELTVKRNP